MEIEIECFAPYEIQNKSEIKVEKGDSFFIRPNTNYKFINHRVREVELSLIQFCSLPTAPDASS